MPNEVLNPRNTWKHPEAYDEKARELAAQFVENFEEYKDAVTPEILNAGPNPDSGKKATIQQIK